MGQKRSILTSLVVAAVVAACGGSDSGMGPDPDDGGDGGDQRVVVANPSFATHIQEILERRGCTASQCHGGGAGGMTLTASASANYAAWVGVASASEPSFLRVKAGDATNSYVVIKVEGRQTVGARMPLNGTALDDIDLTNLRNWINTGAPNN